MTASPTHSARTEGVGRVRAVVAAMADPVPALETLLVAAEALVQREPRLAVLAVDPFGAVALTRSTGPGEGPAGGLTAGRSARTAPRTAATTSSSSGPRIDGAVDPAVRTVTAPSGSGPAGPRGRGSDRGWAPERIPDLAGGPGTGPTDPGRADARSGGTPRPDRPGSNAADADGTQTRRAGTVGTDSAQGFADLAGRRVTAILAARNGLERRSDAVRDVTGSPTPSTAAEPGPGGTGRPRREDTGGAAGRSAAVANEAGPGAVGARRLDATPSDGPADPSGEVVETRRDVPDPTTGFALRRRPAHVVHDRSVPGGSGARHPASTIPTGPALLPGGIGPTGGLDPEELVALVATVLREQARRHGVDLS